MPQGGALSDCRLVHYPNAGSSSPVSGRQSPVAFQTPFRKVSSRAAPSVARREDFALIPPIA